MIRFIVRRLLLMIPVLLGLTVLLFAWIRALPGDPATAMLGDRVTPEAVQRINEQYGFDQPLLQQYFIYLGNLLTGDLGDSIRTGEAVTSSFSERFPATIELAVAALLFAIILGLPLGYFAARHTGTWLDSIAIGASLLGTVVPVFFLAYLLKWAFALELDWFPTSGRQDPRIDATVITNFKVLDGLMTREWDAAWDAVVHLVLPAIALGTIPLAIVTRITRASVLDVLGKDYVRTAEAKGISRNLIRTRHVLKNALLPVVTTVGLQAGLLLAGAVLTETVFAFNGLGSYLFDAINQLDYPVLQGFILFIALTYALINLIVDITYGLIDPRIRVS